MTYEDVLKKVGTFGTYQKRFCLICFLVGVAACLGTLSMNFTLYKPDHICKLQANNTDQENATRYALSLNHTLNERSCNEIVRVNSTHVDVTENRCQNGWNFDDKQFSSAVTKFSIVCNRAWLKPMSISMFMVGEMVGGFCAGWLSDRFGRRRVVLIGLSVQFMSYFATSFSWNVVTFAVMLGLNGFGIYTSYTTAFVLANELMGTNHRNKVSLSLYGGYCFGASIISVFGYLFPDWLWLCRFTGLVGILYIPLYWFIPESPYWLLSTARTKEADQLLTKIALTNGQSSSEKDAVSLFHKKKEENLIADEKQEERRVSNIKIILTSTVVRNRIIISSFSWIVTNMVYYALALNVSVLSGDRFWNMALSGLLEFPGIIVGFLIIQWIGRPLSLSILMGLGGVCLAVAPFIEAVSGGLMTALVLIGKTAIIGAFYINFSITGEMSPTLIRNTSIGITSALGKVGSFTAPYLMFLGDTYERYLPFLIMGGLACASSLATLLVLPETKGKVLPDSIQDAKLLRPKVRCPSCGRV